MWSALPSVKPTQDSAPSLDLAQIAVIDHFTSETLPDLNDHIEAEVWPVRFLYQQWEAVSVQFAGNTNFRSLDKTTARHLLGKLAFIASSAERHHQAKSLPKGSGLACLQQMEAMLLDLAIPAQHIPRDSFITYWLSNRGPELRSRFTGDCQELTFSNAVLATHDLQTASAAAIRPICRNNVPLNAPEAAEALAFAARNTAELCKIYQGLRPPKFEPLFFTERMRTYLVGYPVGGVFYEAVNAADLPAQISIDYLLGFPNDEYYPQVVRRRMVQMPLEEQDGIDRDVATMPLLAAIAKSLGTTLDSLHSIKCTDFARVLTTAPVELSNSILAAGDLYREQQRLTGIHWSLIKQFLINYAKHMPLERKAALPVSPDAGTGRTGHEKTHDIMQMRTHHAAASRLVAITKLMVMENENANVEV